MSTRPIVITGSRGQLGSSFCRKLGSVAVGLSRSELDFDRPEAIESTIERLQPEAVIHCAAYTEVDKAESHPDECFRSNATAVEALAVACNRCGATLVQISTDYVFCGLPDRSIPFVEDAAPNPHGVYAQSKLAGEVAAQTCSEHLIVRTCGLYGPGGNNFVEAMLQQARQHKRVRVVDDQRCTPTYVEHVVQAVLFLLTTGRRDIFHIVNRGSTTWYDFAVEIFQQAKLTVNVERMTTAQYGGLAPRPAYSVLDTTRYECLGGPPLPSWQSALVEYLATRTQQHYDSVGRRIRQNEEHR